MRASLCTCADSFKHAQSQADLPGCSGIKLSSKVKLLWYVSEKPMIELTPAIEECGKLGKVGVRTWKSFGAGDDTTSQAWSGLERPYRYRILGKILCAQELSDMFAMCVA